MASKTEDSETLFVSEDKLALKLKLEPDVEQQEQLNRIFWTWASICNQISLGGKKKDDLRPKSEDGGEWFNSTQLNCAETDVKDLKKALERSAQRLTFEISRLGKRKSDFEEAIRDPGNRKPNPEKASLFVPKAWSDAGLLKAKYHTEKYYKSRVRELARLMDKKNGTLEKINRGNIKFKPTRLTLMYSNIRVSFGGEKIRLSVLDEKPPAEIRLVKKPEQPSVGPNGGKSTEKSAEYLRGAVLNYLAYSINQLFFGLNRSEKMLALAKREEKREKFAKKMSRKEERFPKKVNDLEKLLGRGLSESETRILDGVKQKFMQTVKVEMTPEYRKFLLDLASELYEAQSFLDLKKYPVLLRKPQTASKHKNIKNLKSGEWEYYIQFGYNPILDDRTPITPTTIMGIDRGLRHALAVSIFDPSGNSFVLNKLEPNPVFGWKWRERRLRRSIQHLERKIRAQENVHIQESQMKKRLHTLDGSVNNFWHNLSARLVDLALEHRSAIVLESLSSMRQHARGKGARMKQLNYALSNFDYGRIAALIVYKAKRKGVPVFEVLPENTSKTCAKCLLEGNTNASYERGITDNGKKNMKIGRCSIHGDIDADLNAARTIALCYHKKLNNPLPFGERKRFK